MVEKLNVKTYGDMVGLDVGCHVVTLTASEAIKVGATLMCEGNKLAAEQRARSTKAPTVTCKRQGCRNEAMIAGYCLLCGDGELKRLKDEGA
jgi:hypothetical protein